MKKRLVILLAGLLTVLSMGFGLAQFSDVPAGHWAKEAVEALAAKGIIVGFPDGTFRGNETLTRYQAALIIYRLLQQIEEELKARGTSPTMEALSAEDLEALRNAIQELAAELAALGVRVSALEDNAATKDDIARLEALIQELKAQPAPEPGMDQAALQDLMDRVEAASIAADTALAQAQQVSERLEALSQSVEDLKDQLADLASRVEAAVAAAQEALDQVQRQMGDAAALQSQVEANAAAIQALNELAVQLNQDILALQDRVTALEKLVSGGAELPDLDQFATKEDVAAVQEFAAALRSDLVALAEQLQQLGDRLQELAQLSQDVEGVKEALADLTDRVEAASIAADTALAQVQQLAEQLEALAQDVEGVKGDVAALQTQVEANAGAIQALNELAVLLNQDVLSLQDRVTALEKGLADLQGVNFEEFATKEDVAAIQEFAAALRSDLVGLSEKVTKLEGQVTDLSGKVATLQRNAFTISGSLSLSYFQYHKTGAAQAFDVDRLFSSNFSTGDANRDGAGLVVDDADLGPDDSEGQTTATLNLTLQTGALEAKSAPGGYNAYPGLVQFSIKGSWTNPGAGSGVTPNLVVDKVSTTLGVAQGQTLSFTFGQSVRSKFTEYVFDNDAVSRGHGFVAVYDPGLLGAKLTGVYGSRLANNGDNLYFYGARLTLKPADMLSLGASAVREAQPGGASSTTVYGVDASLSLGPIGLSGEYFNSDAASNANGYYLKAKAALGPVSAEANYRNIGAGVNSAHMLSGDTGSGANAAPFHKDQQGYGVKATLGLGPVALTGFYDTYDDSAGAPVRTAYGVEAKATLAAFTLTGYYRVADAGKDGTEDDSAPNETAAATGGYGPGGNNFTQYGAQLRHDGKADNALVKNLNLTASYDVRPKFAPGARTDIAVYGDFSFEVAILKVTLLGRYHSQDVAGSAAQSYSTLKYGVKAETQPLAVVLKPSLMGEYVARSTTGGTANNSETKYAFGLKLGEFLFPNSSLEVKYGAYQGQNISSVLVGNAEKAWDASVDHIYDANVNVSGINGSISGLYVSWSYWDLVFSWGQFQVDNNGTKTDNATAFKITYTVKF